MAILRLLIDIEAVTKGEGWPFDKAYVHTSIGLVFMGLIMFTAEAFEVNKPKVHLAVLSH